MEASNVRKRSRATQTPVANVAEKEVQVGDGVTTGSYQRKYLKCQPCVTTFRYLLNNVLCSKNKATQWCFENNIITSCRSCPKCNNAMNLTNSSTSYI